MPTPVSTLTGTSATGDLIAGPGFPTFIINGLPVATVANAVAGAACTGVIASTMHPTMLFGALPVASLTCTVTGVNPITGIPISTAEAQSVAAKFIV